MCQCGQVRGLVFLRWTSPSLPLSRMDLDTAFPPTPRHPLQRPEVPPDATPQTRANLGERKRERDKVTEQEGEVHLEMNTRTF